jgi:hypothetical protein
MKHEELKLALDDLIAEYHMETSSFAKRVDEIFKQAQPAPSLLAFAQNFLDDYQTEDGMQSMKHYAGQAQAAIDNAKR